MGGKSKPPPPPDYSGLIGASVAASQQSAQIAEEQLRVANDQFQAAQAQNQPLVAAQTRAANVATAMAISDREFWNQNYKPVETKLASDAMTYDDPANMERLAGQAGAEVASQYGQARSAAEDQLQSYGVDPSRAQAGALDLGYRIAEAGATAQAVNQSRANTENTAIAMRQNVANVGRGLQQVASGELGQSVGANSAAISGNLAAPQTFMGATMSPATWTSMSNAALGQAGNLTNTGYTNALNYTELSNQTSSGLAGLAGTALGIIGGKALSSWNPFGGSTTPKYATGGSVGADYAPPSPTMDGRQGAIAVPPDAGGPPNPQQGTDTVHAMLTPGEYVIPKDVAMRRGTDALDKYVFNERIKSAQQRMEQQQAIPTIAHPQQPQATPGGANIPRQALPMVA